MLCLIVEVDIFLDVNSGVLFLDEGYLIVRSKGADDVGLDWIGNFSTYGSALLYDLGRIIFRWDLNYELGLGFETLFALLQLPLRLFFVVS